MSLTIPSALGSRRTHRYGRHAPQASCPPAGESSRELPALWFRYKTQHVASPGCPPAGKRRSEYQVVVIGLPPVLVGVVCRLQVYLPAEIQQLLLEDRPKREAFGYLQLSGVEGNFEGRNEVTFRHPPVSAHLVSRVPPVMVTGVNRSLLPFSRSVTATPTPVLSTTREGGREE